ncbi:uncharacterized protein [Pyrus communis]|uniref:uncharacterized protein n=1 Tax=Pyrus communis TaxID=23211 RepID=UPI0035C0B5DA
MAAAIVCRPTEEQHQWGDSIAGRSYKPRNRAMSHANLMNNYFNPNSKWDRASRPGFSPHQKVTVALRMMVYGSLADSMDETHVHKDEYLREPNQEDLNRLLRKAEDRGFLGMTESLDCMHWD